MRKGLLGSLAALVTGGGIALAQAPYAYPPPGWQLPPQQYIQPGNVSLIQGLPQGYGQPFMPAQPAIARPVMMPQQPVMHGWPPPPGAIPLPPGTVIQAPARAQAAPTPVTPNAVAPNAVTQVTTPGQTPLDKSPVMPAAPANDKGLVFSALRRATEAPGVPAMPAIGKTRSETPLFSPMVHPAPGSPLMCEEACDACAPPVYEPKRQHHSPRGYHCYAKAEFLYWGFSEQESPILFQFPVRLQPTTIDANEIDNEERIGGRLTLGCWVNHDQCLALEGVFFQLADRHPERGISATSIDRPFIDPVTGATGLLSVAAPGTAIGAANLSSHMRLYGAEINLRKEIARCCWGHIDVIAGIRHMDLDESLKITTVSGPAAGGPILTTSDRFGTRNMFWGGQLGIDAEVNWSRYFVGAYGKVALGSNIEQVTIAGNTVTDAGGGAITSAQGGFLAQAGNIGYYKRSEFAVLPEFGVNVGVRLGDHVRLFGGYSILYLLDAVRPADQIDQRGSLAAIPPLFGFQENDFWAHGLNVGLEVRY